MCVCRAARPRAAYSSSGVEARPTLTLASQIVDSRRLSQKHAMRELRDGARLECRFRPQRPESR